VKPFTPDELARAIAAALQAGTERASTTLLHSEGTPQ
jgi:uncharacterized protein (DUF849 family)